MREQPDLIARGRLRGGSTLYPRLRRVQFRHLNGETVQSNDFRGIIGADESKEMGVVDWTTPGQPGVYVLRGTALEDGVNGTSPKARLLIS